MSDKAGRPTSWKAEYAEQALSLALLGLTDAEMAKVFGVQVSTFNNWKKAHPELMESLKEGKEEADAKISKSLYQTALDGNTTAQIFWLKNRRSKQWRDKHEVEHSGSLDIADRMTKAQKRSE